MEQVPVLKVRVAPAVLSALLRVYLQARVTLLQLVDVLFLLAPLDNIAVHQTTTR